MIENTPTSSCETVQGLAAIDAALDANMSAWRSLSNFDVCEPRRSALLEQAAAAPITSFQDAADKLRIVLKHANPEGLEHWNDDDVDIDCGFGLPATLHFANILRSVQRYLATLAGGDVAIHGEPDRELR